MGDQQTPSRRVTIAGYLAGNRVRQLSLDSVDSPQVDIVICDASAPRGGSVSTTTSIDEDSGTMTVVLPSISPEIQADNQQQQQQQQQVDEEQQRDMSPSSVSTSPSRYSEASTELQYGGGADNQQQHQDEGEDERERSPFYFPNVSLNRVMGRTHCSTAPASLANGANNNNNDQQQQQQQQQQSDSSNDSSVIEITSCEYRATLVGNGCEQSASDRQFVPARFLARGMCDCAEPTRRHFGIVMAALLADYAATSERIDDERQRSIQTLLLFTSRRRPVLPPSSTMDRLQRRQSVRYRQLLDCGRELIVSTRNEVPEGVGQRAACNDVVRRIANVVGVPGEATRRLRDDVGSNGVAGSHRDDSACGEDEVLSLGGTGDESDDIGSIDGFIVDDEDETDDSDF